MKTRAGTAQTCRDPGRHPCQYPYPRLRYGFLAVRVRVAPIVPAGYPCHCLLGIGLIKEYTAR